MKPAKLQTIRLLNGLAQINNERAAVYNKILELQPGWSFFNSTQANMQNVFSEFLRDSKMFAKTLSNIVIIEGGKMPYGLKLDQYLYQLAMGIKDCFQNLNSSNFLSIIKKCETIALSAYEFVLNEPRLAVDPKGIVAKQQYNISESENFIRSVTFHNEEQMIPDGKNNGIIINMNNVSTSQDLMAQVI